MSNQGVVNGLQSRTQERQPPPTRPEPARYNGPGQPFTWAGTGWSQTQAGAGVDQLEGSAIRLINRYRVTEDPRRTAIGSPIHVDYSPTVDYPGSAVVGPNYATGYFGPRAIVNVEGKATQNFSTTLFGLTPIGMAIIHETQNQAGKAINMTPAWGYIATQIYTADGATVTQVKTDTADGHVSYVDNSVFRTKNSGTWTNGTGTDHIGFLSIPAMYGNTTMTNRVAFDVRNTLTGSTAWTPYYPSGEAADGSLLGGDATVGTVTNQIGLRVERLVRGTTSNLAVKADSPVKLWSDSPPAFTAALEQAILTAGVGGSFTLNFANANAAGVTIGGSWAFSQAAHPYGGVTGVAVQPTLTSSLTSTWLNVQTAFVSGPTFTQSTNAATAAVVADFYANPTFNTTAGGTLTVSILTALQSAPTIGAGVTVTSLAAVTAAPIVNGTVTTRYALNVADPTGSGTIGVQYGLYVASLTKATTNYGIYCTPGAWLTGGIYGSTSSGGDLTLYSTSHATKGNLNLAVPSTVLASDGVTITSGNVAGLLRSAATITMNASGGGAGTGNQYIGARFDSTVSFTQAGNVLGSFCLYDTTTYKNTSGSGNIDLGQPYQVRLNPTIQADGATITVDYNVVGVHAAPTLDRINSGTLTVANVINYAAARAIVKTGTTLTNSYGLYVEDTTVTGGTVTNNIGIEIAAQTAGSTLNIGLRNAASTILGNVVYLHNDNKTVTATGYQAVTQSPTITLDVSSAAAPSYYGHRYAGTISWSQNQYLYDAAVGTIADYQVYTNDSGTAITNTGVVVSQRVYPTLQALAANNSFTAYYCVETKPTLTRVTSGNLTVSTLAGYVAGSPAVGAYTTVTGGFGFSTAAPMVAANGTVTTWTGLKIADGANSGTFTTQYGIDIASLAAASTNVSIRVSGTAPILLAPKTSFGSSATAATWNAHVMGGNSAATALGLDSSTTGPTAPASNAAGVISIYKGATNYYLLITFNDGGTTRYRHMQLNGSTVTTFTHSTSLPA